MNEKLPDMTIVLNMLRDSIFCKITLLLNIRYTKKGVK